MATFNASSFEMHFELTPAANASAPTLLLSNSLGTTLDMWDPQVDALRKHYGLLRYDTRGHGASGVPGGPYSMDDLGNDVIALLDHLKLSRVHACGLSLGGMIVQWLAINTPTRISSAVICNTGAVTASPPFWRERTGIVLRDGMTAIVEGVMSRFFSESFRQSSPEKLEQIKHTFLATAPIGYAGCCAAIESMDFRAGLPHVTLDALVIAGLQDQAAPRESVKEVALMIPHSHYVEIDAAHISNIENPAAFNTALLDFLAEVPQ
jgi:3-oxoadipate enol-lactonase